MRVCVRDREREREGEESAYLLTPPSVLSLTSSVFFCFEREREREGERERGHD